MRDPLDIFISDDPSPDELRQLRQMLETDADLARLCARWARTVEHHRERWEARLPDRSILLLHVLEESGRADLLTDEDREVLEANRGVLLALDRDFESLDDVRRRIAEDCRVFDEVWQERVVPPRADREARRGQTRRGRPSRWLWRIPVAVAVALFAIVAVLIIQRDAALETVATGDDETHLVEFADGSTIHLMENSRLQYVPEEGHSPVNRRAILEGKALFDITAQQQGFIVETPVAMATVLGTLFGVDATGDQTEVTLVEGRVALANQQRKEAAVVLSAGQQSRVFGTAMPTQPELVDLQEALSWTRLFIFRSTALREIAARLSEHYDVRVVVHDSLVEEEITGTFDQDEPVASILRTIAAAVNARVEERGPELHVLPQ